MDILLESVKVLGRIATILPLLLAIGLYMGKRSMGELPVFDFLVVLVLGSVVGADIADPKINHIHTVIAMIAIAILHRLITYLKLNSPRFGRMITFQPTVVIYNGRFVDKNMKKVKFSIDNIIQLLREKNIFTVKDVEIAVVEANGRISAKLKTGKEWVTKEEFGLRPVQGEYDIPVILDGYVQVDLLNRMGRDENWLRQQLAKDNITNFQDIFYAALTPGGTFLYSQRDGKSSQIPPIDH
ncbi:DUF421 domain-containing protein [Halobacillus massiliensis]|uniref:DUF421 domain-containing protein n=1 Tax=Halobacillus massiliensis TaxID=1926286 RepID=UPI00117A5E34|nr:DUF421 domain-containing protein [Halobacillus massiliensis]